jgi:RimJ/RimL family protein N-acetyltransferase
MDYPEAETGAGQITCTYYGRAALARIIRCFRNHGAHVLHLSTEPNNELGLHVYHKLGFRETGEFDEDEAILKLEL